MATFSIIDYVLFIVSLSLSAAIGIYFAFFEKKENTEDAYLYGNKKMKAIPVGLSLYSSAISTISIIGIPVEIYTFGTGYVTSIIGMVLGLFLIWIFFLPVFCGNLNIKTPYEYFEQRFDNSVKLMSSFIYIIHTILMMPIVLYAPSLAVSEVTGIHLFTCTFIIGGICILYTTFGGFKTVIWTDTLQATLMLLSCLFVAIVGVNKAGGFNEMWEKAKEGNRLNFFNMDPNPFQRITFWSAVIGITFVHASHSGCSAGALQRYMSLPNQNQAKISTLVGLLGTILMNIIGGITGLAMYAVYYNCDPIKNNTITTPNKLVPYFVTNTLELNYNIPGFSGFFIAGLLSAALSTLSSELNVVGGIIYYDFIMKFFRNKFTENKGLLIMKIIVVVNGLIYLFPVLILQKSNHIYELTINLGGITYGAKLGMLLLGILFPKSNSKGVILGALTSIIFISWLSFGVITLDVKSYYKLPTSIENCKTQNTTISNSTISLNKKNLFEDIFILYKVSYLYYCLIGTIITIGVGYFVSYVTGFKSLHDINPLLVAPFLRNYIISNQQCEMEKIELDMDEKR